MSIATSLLQMYVVLPLAAICWLLRPALLKMPIIHRQRPDTRALALVLLLLAIDAAIVPRLNLFSPSYTLKILAIDAVMLACLLAIALRRGLTSVDLCVVFSLVGIVLGLTLPSSITR